MSGQTDGRPDGGAPLLGEPLAIEFANTHYAVRGLLTEGIGTPDHLGAWLRANATALGLDPTRPDLNTRIREAEVATFQALRDAIRGIAQATLAHHPADPAQLRTLNHAAAAAPRWPTLTTSGTDYQISEQTSSDTLQAALSAIARDAIAIFGGPLRTRLRACPAHGCALLFIKDHPRREWCSPACGNRARAARHYHRHRDHPATS
jgi:predicted RNA-binding Zn ribbon-like protein